MSDERPRGSRWGSEPTAAALEVIESIAGRFATATPQEIATLLVNVAVEELGALRATLLPPAPAASRGELASAGRPREPESPPSASALFHLTASGQSFGLLVAEFADPLERPLFEMLVSLTRQAGEALSRAAERVAFRRDAAMLTALYVVAEAVTHAGTVAEVFERVVATLSEVLGADQVLSMICTQAGGEILPGPAAGLSEEQTVFFKELAIGPPHLPVATRVQETLTFEVIPDAGDTDLLSPEFISMFGAGTVVVIPLVRWRQTLAILQLHFAARRAVSEEDLALLDAVARQASVGVENAFLQRDLRERLEDLRRLQGASRMMLGATDLDTVFREIAHSGRELMDCAAAVVWLLDRPGGYLYRVAWEGLLPADEAGGATLPLKGTLEGAALRTRTPTHAGEEEHRGELRPQGAFLSGRLGSALAVPVSSAVRGPFGVLTFLHETGSSFRPSDDDLARLFAATAALAIEGADRRQAEQEVVRVLQTALIPGEMPLIPGLDIAVAANLGELAVGGDFVDVFDLGGNVGISVGDVSGRGPEAASFGVMAEYMIRALASRNPSPSSVAFHLNRALRQSLERERFITLLYGVYEASDRRLLLVNCGAWPPLLLHQGEVHTIEGSGGLLGAFDDLQYPEVEVFLEPGDVILGFTDGIPEARRGKETFGTDDVTRLLGESATEPAEAIAERIMEAARIFAGGTLGDDAVVVAVRAVETGDEELPDG